MGHHYRGVGKMKVIRRRTRSRLVTGDERSPEGRDFLWETVRHLPNHEKKKVTANEMNRGGGVVGSRNHLTHCKYRIRRKKQLPISLALPSLVALHGTQGNTMAAFLSLRQRRQENKHKQAALVMIISMDEVVYMVSMATVGWRRGPGGGPCRGGVIVHLAIIESRGPLDVQGFNWRISISQVMYICSAFMYIYSYIHI